MEIKKIYNFINGQFIDPIDHQYINNYDPSTGEIYSLTPNSNEKDVALAVESAKEIFPIWSSMPSKERGDVLLRIAEGIRSRMEEFVYAESKDSGKPIQLARKMDIPRAISNFEFFGTAIQHTETQAHYMEQKGFNYTLRRPIGLVGCISPWNLPLYLFSWKIAPALATGNCVIAKPSEITPYTAYLLGEVVKEAQLPDGVLSILHGLGNSVGQAIVSHPSIKAISFTGGTNTGAAIAQTAGPLFKKISLELGGKNPTIIFDDCHFEETLKNVVRSSFTNQGQICLCGSRIFIQHSLYERFKRAFIDQVAKLKVSYPSDPLADMGALVSETHLKKIEYYISLAKEEGGKILCGGNRITLPEPYQNGYYLQPTIIEGLEPTCRTNQEEIFGPLVTLTPFNTEQEAIELANSTQYGLSASVFTTHLEQAHRVAERLEVGIVWINDWLVRDLRTPFGGVKNSGVGREGGWDAIEFFTESKNIFVKIPS